MSSKRFSRRLPYATEILQNIFTRLPTKERVAVARASKRFYLIIADNDGYWYQQFDLCYPETNTSVKEWLRWFDKAAARVEDNHYKKPLKFYIANGVLGMSLFSLPLNWFRRYTARKQLESNWKHGRGNSFICDYPAGAIDSKNNAESPFYMLTTNIWGTVIRVGKCIYYSPLQDKSPKLVALKAPDTHASTLQSAGKLSAAVNNQFIAILVSSSQKCYFWRLDKAAKPTFSGCLELPREVESIEDLRANWLVFRTKDNMNRGKAYIYDLTKDGPTPRVSTYYGWHIYKIHELRGNKAIVYAAHLGSRDNISSAQSQDYYYNQRQYGASNAQAENTNLHWTLWRVTPFSLCTEKAETHSMAFSMSSPNSEWKSRQLTDDSYLIWRDDSNKNGFIIVHSVLKGIQFAKEFTGATPTVSINNDRVIMSTTTEWSVTTLSTKQLIHKTKIGDDLTYIGTALERFWVTRHEEGVIIFDVKYNDEFSSNFYRNATAPIGISDRGIVSMFSNAIVWFDVGMFF
ncbi:hypothetical protein THASP1DRAFT_29743 [Thamnocephalis sphaerospora]|uniref:F-box domain-containing protein n=1 Tax=Thamnocephalis sphaerospora TaxID=78915 RepID=A0A4P9XQW2_9FUNG|nr:hypothetical protein THASP1DRAFT_29743 [Thamnocephalis sphaerospora]|eukprot:RKP08444.1 hypothetical protein THASP1DRAFT_29743 [Thamnocephalis sphaerospora]